MDCYKVIILGKNGMLGRYFSTYLSNRGFDTVSLGRDDIDVYGKSFKELFEYFEQFKNNKKLNLT